MIIFVHFYFPFSVHCYIIIYTYHACRQSGGVPSFLSAGKNTPFLTGTGNYHGGMGILCGREKADFSK